MNNDFEEMSFKNDQEAKSLLSKSRNRIDEIDNELFDLIFQRTSLAKDIARSKEYLGIPIYDKSREAAIHEKVEKVSQEKGLDVDIINQIVNMLIMLSKNEQKEILKEEC